MISYKNERTLELRGLSTDTKPTDSYLENGSIFVEMDTSTIYTYDKSSQTWLVLDIQGGGGGGGGVSHEEFNAYKEQIRDELDETLVNTVQLEIEESNGDNESVDGNLVYTYKDGSKHIITSLAQLRDYILTPSQDTPDVEDTELEDSELTVIVTDSDGQAVKMTLDQLRTRFLSTSSHDSANIEDAQIGEFIYEEVQEEGPADWLSMNGQATWEAEFADPTSTLNKYYAWSDDVNKPYKEDLWNTVENRPANINDARKVDGEYVYDENGNYIYDNCERCWLGAINAPGASYPWAVVTLPIPFEGTIRFQYKDEEPVYPWGEAVRTFSRGFAIASIPSELNKPELQINAAGESEVPLLDGDLVITLVPKEEEL